MAFIRILLLMISIGWTMNGSAEADKDKYDYWLCDPSEVGKAKMKWPEHLRPYGAAVDGNPGSYVPTVEYGENSQLRQLAKSVGRLEILLQKPDGTTVGSTCTASAISRDHILTNHHCIPGEREGWKVVKALVRFGYYTDDSEGDVYEVEVTPADTNSERDYTVLVAKGDFAAKWGYLDLSRVSSRNISDSEEAVIIHHPAGKPQKISTDCKFSSVDETDAFHNCSSQPGSSGSPMFRKVDGKYELVAIHYAASRNEPNSKFSKRLDKVNDTSHYFNRIVPPIVGTYNQVAVMTKGVFKAQNFIVDEKFPTDWVKSHWDKGYRITDVTSVSRNTSPVTKKWNELVVVMSTGAGINGQKYYHEPKSEAFPKEWVTARQSEGYPITSCSYFDNSWVIVAAETKALREQVVVGPSAKFPDASIKEYWDKGYKITTACAGYLPSSESAWLVVMSRTADYTTQSYLISESFPGDFVKEKWDKGFRITSVENGDGWLVVMSQGPGLDRLAQKYLFRSYFPFGGVSTGYSEGYTITGVAGEY